MEETYTGHFLANGHFVNDDGVRAKLPVNRQVVVNILNKEADPLTSDTELHRRQVAAVENFLADVANLAPEDDVLTDEDWDELAASRSQVEYRRFVYEELQKTKAALNDPNVELHDAVDVFARLEQKLIERGL